MRLGEGSTRHAAAASSGRQQAEGGTRRGEGSSRRSLYRSTSFRPRSNFTFVPSTQYITGMYYRVGVEAWRNVTCGGAGRSTRGGGGEQMMTMMMMVMRMRMSMRHKHDLLRWRDDISNK